MSGPEECRHEGADERMEFCPQCHVYLAWDKPDEAPTVPLPDLRSDPGGSVAVAAPPPIDARHNGSPPRRAAISLREDEGTDHPIKTNPGDTVTLHVRVRNQSAIVDEFVLAVEGWLLDGWWDIQPPELYLLPFGTGHPSSCEGEATVKLHPPRNWRATAGVHEIAITVTSTASREKVADLALELDVRSYPDVRLTVDRDLRARRRKASFELTVENAGNKPVTLAPSGRVGDDKCTLTFIPGELKLAPGENRPATVLAQASPHPVGRPIDHTITLFALAPGEAPPESKHESLRDRALAEATARGGKVAGAQISKAKKAAKAQTAALTGGAAKLGKTLGLKKLPAAAPPPRTGTAAPVPAPAAEPASDESDADRLPSCTCTYRQKAWVPAWVIAAAAILIALFLWALKSRVAVPNVNGHYISAARDEIKKAGLEGVERPMVPPYPYRVRSKLKAGDVFAEVPHVNTKVCVGFPGNVFGLIPYLGPTMCRTSSIGLRTVVWRGSARVPNLFGLTPSAAEHQLTKHGFAIGNIQPYPPPKGDVIVNQSPDATARRVNRTTAVDVTLGQVAAVPDLTGQTPAGAEQMLRPTGLLLGQITPKHAPTSAVIATQSITAGKIVQAGEELNVGLGLPVPKLKGAGLAQASKKLAALGFRLGAVKPTQPPAGYVVAREAPGGGAIAPLYARVNLTLAPPPKKKPKKKASSSAGAAKPVPSVAGATAAAAAAAIAKTGAKTRTTYAISAKVPAGKLISTRPAAGSKVGKGKVVTLVVSAGYPEIAVDDGHRIVALNGLSGKVLTKVVAGPQAATEPSWSPQGTKISYVSGGRIMLTAARGPSGPAALTRADATFALPTFPPTPSAPNVLAAIGGRHADELCLLAVVARAAPSCRSVPGWTLEGEITWSPHGTEILVGARESSGAIGLLKFTSQTPFATKAGAWKPHGLVTPAVGGAGVRAAAFSPNGSQLALAEDLGAPSFLLALVAPSDLMLAKANTFVAPTPACTVGWRADSQEVLVQTSTGSGCSARMGSVYVVDPAHPRALSLIATGVADAVWQPLPGVG